MNRFLRGIGVVSVFLFIAQFSGVRFSVAQSSIAKEASKEPPKILDLVQSFSKYYQGYTSFISESNEPVYMLRDYLLTVYKDNPEKLKEYKILEEDSMIETDTFIAGILIQRAIFSETEYSIQYLIKNFPQNHYDEKKLTTETKKIIEDLYSLGAVFGFDGGKENSTLHSIPYLLILDPAAKKMYGIDLNPTKTEK